MEFEIPESFKTVSYNEKAFPGSAEAIGFKNGANCQHFAYELLRYFGKKVPNLRSSNLWEDVAYSQFIEKGESLEELDLLFFNFKEEPFGSHICVYIGNGKVVHLSKNIGKPEITTIDNLVKIDKYVCFLGVKRII